MPTPRIKAAEGNQNTYNLPRGEPIRRAMRDIFREQRNAVLAGLRSGHKAIESEAPALPSRMPRWDDLRLGALALSHRMTPLISAVWERAGAAFAPRVGLDPNEWSVVNPHTEPMIAAAAFNFCRSTNESTSLKLDDALHQLRVAMIKGVVDEGDAPAALTKLVKEIFDKLETRKARTIAQTETSRAVHAAQEQSAYASKVVTGFRWLASADACPEICLAIVARSPTVRLGEAFAHIGSNPHYSTIRYPPAHPNCNCSMTEVLITDAQPTFHNTVYEPKPATEEELDAITADQADRLNEIQRTWDPDTGLYGSAPSAPSTPRKPKVPKPKPGVKPKPAAPVRPRKPTPEEPERVIEQTVEVAPYEPPGPGEDIPERDDQPDPIPAAPAKPAAETFGESAATVGVAGGDDKDAVEGTVKRVLGTDATLQDAASISGATDDATVTVSHRDWENTVYVTVNSKDYNAYRTFGMDDHGTRWLSADSFYVEENMRGKGIIGPQVFGRMVEQSVRLAFGRIETHASRAGDDNGYYTWPRFGYDADIPANVRARPPSLAGAKRISDLMMTDEGRQWWKIHGVTMDMTFDLKPGSLSLRIWNAYLAAKRAAAKSSRLTFRRLTSKRLTRLGRRLCG